MANYKKKPKISNIIVRLIIILCIFNICRKIKELQQKTEIKPETNEISSSIIWRFSISKKSKSPYNTKNTIVKLLIILSNDVHPNPGPKACGICHQSSKLNIVSCVTCNTTYHIICLTKIANEIKEGTCFMWVCPKYQCPPNYHNDSKDKDGNPLSPNRFEPLRTQIPDPPVQQITKNSKKKSKETKKPKQPPKQNKFLAELTTITAAEYIGKPWCTYCQKYIETHQSHNHCEACNISIHLRCQNKMQTEKNNMSKTCEIRNCPIKTLHTFKEEETPEKIKQVRRSPDEFIIVNLNARSLVNKYEELELICENVKPDIICTTESWFDDSVPQNACIPTGYKLIRKDRSKAFKKKYNKSSGGGLAIFYKDNIFLEEKTFLTDKTEEILWVQPKIKESFLLGLIYKPNYSDMLQENKEESILENNIRKATEVSNRIIICGDFNIDMKTPENLQTQQLSTLYETYQLKQFITKPTRINTSTGKGTLIDHFWATKEAPDVKNEGTFIGLSDHFATYITINITKLPIPDEKIKFRNFKNYNIDNYRADLDSQIKGSSKLEKSLTDRNVNAATEEVVKILQCVGDTHAPEIEISTKWKKQKIPWFNNLLKHKINQKNELLEDQRLYNSKCFKNKIKELNNEIHYLKRKLKKQYIVTKLNESEGNPKAYWKVINDILFRGATKESIEPDMMDQEKVNKINKFFATIGSEIQKNLKVKIHSKSFTGLRGFTFKPETEAAISKIFDQIKVDTATGLDNIPSKLLKDGKEVLVPVITRIINLGYEESIFPDCLKQARIKPLYKNEDLNDPKNYRPISILPTLSKIFERAAANQITRHLEQNEYICPHQHAYRRKHSTQTCLIEVINHLYKLLEHKQIPAIISLDLSKAFDSINHDLLLNKLADLNLSEISIAWMKSYLTGRRQMTKFKHFTSGEEEVTSGIPQGSILGPLMFVCFTNDFPSSFDESFKVMSYADDTQIIVNADNFEDLKAKIKQAIGIAQIWYKENTMKLNVGKTELLIIDQNISRNFKLFFINDRKLIKIKPKPVIKVLGIKIDYMLNWNSQINYVKSKSINAIRNVHRINHFLPIKHRILLYNSLICPHFDYSDVVWGGCGIVNSQKLQAAQNFAVRSITGSRKRDSVSASFRKLKFLQLHQRRYLHEVVFTHKSLTFLNPSEINNTYLEQLSICDNRSSYSGKLVPPKHKTAKYSQSPFYRTIQSWNSCPPEFPTGNIKQHKKLLHKHLIKETYDKH